MVLAFNGDHRIPPSAPALSNLEVLIVDGAVEADTYAQVLRQTYLTVKLITCQRTGVEYLQRATPSLVVAALTPSGGSAAEICRGAKSKPIPASVLMTAETPEDVPDALVAGCDGVLLKPISACLLINRTSLMMRVRMDRLRLRARSRGKGAERLAGAELLKLDLNREWPNLSCPYCSHHGVTSFEHASMRREWYACLQCRKVWMAKRRDG